MFVDEDAGRGGSIGGSEKELVEVTSKPKGETDDKE
jgi:hypothetical protein